LVNDYLTKLKNKIIKEDKSIQQEEWFIGDYTHVPDDFYKLKKEITEE